MNFFVLLLLIIIAFMLGFILGQKTISKSDSSLPKQPPQPLTPSEKAEIIELIRSGQKIEALKRYRQYLGLSLTEAKKAVEQLEREL